MCEMLLVMHDSGSSALLGWFVRFLDAVCDQLDDLLSEKVCILTLPWMRKRSCIFPGWLDEKKKMHVCKVALCMDVHMGVAVL